MTNKNKSFFTGSISKLIVLLILIFAILLTIKISRIKLIEKTTNSEYVIVLEKLREAAKLVVWEQDFQITNTTQKENKYFNLDVLKFTEKVITSARGKIGFHIDLADSVNTKIIVSKDLITVEAPLQLTYLSIDNSTINQIKEASFDPTLRVDKEQIVKDLNEIALRQNLNPAILQAKSASLSKQEQFLERLTGKKVKIILTEFPTMENALMKINKKG